MKITVTIICILLLAFGCKQEKKDSTPNTKTQEIASKYSCAPATTDTLWYSTNSKAPLFDGLDAINYPISTNNPEAQKYFNQGLVLAYGFNHAEAARSFYYATKLDPDCAMCYWGYAYVLGPNYNAGMEPDNYERAFKAIQKAKSLAENASQKEKDLINAMSRRYVEIPPEDRSSLDKAYSETMKLVSKTYPDDLDIKTMYVESLMDLHPWDLFDKKGKPKPWTGEIVNTLEEIIEKNPKHPGAHHFYIHAVEASNTPERAYASANVFDKGLVSGSGHLVHMPSHVYIRTGDYHKGTLANINAVKVDSTYVTLCHAQGTYPLAYYPHNYHFMAATATLEGNSKWALVGANKVSEHVHPEIMKTPGWGTLQHYYVIPYYVNVKLGKWDDILNSDLKTYDLPYPTAVRHYARGMAFLGKNDIDSAKKELNELEKLSANENLKEVTIWDLNSVYTLMQIARRILKAEILASQKHFDDSIVLLKEAAAIEDQLNYDEPPDWFFSVRHHLGAVQLEAGKYKNAIKTYNQDLKRLPKNGWAQHGLKIAYQKLNDQENLSIIEASIKESWAHADIEITSSRIK
ncbi:tetratricopeptide repeat protein [Mangrovimonas aestuarii]|uniref:tetratricopeptide repeat protein n=1 Tax=Mangrovimonas aestuarii TaxID=3018443 RepID=UPI0023790FFE|nr:hypothetical protein [Mangrovimonas aestuarii]